MRQGIITKVAGPLIVAENMGDATMYDVVRVSDQRLIGEIIELRGDRASIQVYEETAGLGPGDAFGGAVFMEQTGLRFIDVKVFFAHAEKNGDVLFPDNVALAENRPFLNTGFYACDVVTEHRDYGMGNGDGGHGNSGHNKCSPLKNAS